MSKRALPIASLSILLVLAPPFCALAAPVPSRNSERVVSNIDRQAVAARLVSFGYTREEAAKALDILSSRDIRQLATHPEQLQRGGGTRTRMWVAVAIAVVILIVLLVYQHGVPRTLYG